MKAVVFTLGCKVNECESDFLLKGLKERGYEVDDKLVPADLYIVNTCAVTAEAEKKSRQTAARIRRLNPEAKIIFTGCAAEKNPDAFLNKGGNCLVTGVFGKKDILDITEEVGKRISPPCAEYEEMDASLPLRTRAFVKIQDGCDNFCTYCIIPYLRGRSRSRAPDNVLREINSLSSPEIVLNGIDLSSYRYGEVDLAGLIGTLCGVDKRIRLGSLEAGAVTERLLDACFGLKNFAPHFHVSLQSGSDGVLKKMNRRYTAEEFIAKINLIRSYFPDAGITTDVIAGFPTETDEDFSQTVELIEKVGFSDVHAFPFSPRSGTAAFKMKDLPPEVKRERLNVLLSEKRKAKENFALKMKGKTEYFLCEEKKDGFYTGYTGNYLRLYLKEEVACGEIVKVKIGSAHADGAFAEKEK